MSDGSATPRIAGSIGVAETIPIEHETIDRAVRTVVVGAPLAAFACGAWLAWGGSLHWHDLVVLAITYTLTGMGITIGYHRLLTHRRIAPERQRAGTAAARLPIPGYDDLDGQDVGGRLASLSQVELAAVEIYERSHAERPEVLNRLRHMHCSEPLP
jgi:hypothetical protein